MIGSWEWFGERKPKLKKSTYIIYRLERILLLITTSFLGIWILISEISEIFQSELTVTYYYKKDSFENTIEIFYNIFGIFTIIPISIVFVAIRKRSKSLYALFYFASLIEALIILCRLLFSFHKEYISYCRIFRLHNFYPYDGKGYYPNVKLNIDNNITYRVRFFIAIPTLIFLTILLINTYLCMIRIDDEFILLIYGSENKQILLQNIKEYLKKVLKDFLHFLGKKSESNEHIKKLGVNAWKFIPESRILLNEIVIVSDENDKNTNNNTFKKDHECVEIDFNTKFDVMIQTNYPLLNINNTNNIPSDTTALNISTLSTSLPAKYWFYYYEITILLNENNDKTIIAIGLASKNYSTNRLPGCNIHSVGFHSDEGRIFHNEKYTGSKYAEKWGEVNDVIGCGYYPNTGQVFFTMNGKNLDTAYTGLFHTWYPTIGSNGTCKLKVNFGQEEFMYKEANGMSVAGIIS
ncbi:unnamed protein product [Rhizophagus irregularis]|nr:unnamed protein product [Rhizophagus irregularis]